MQPAIRLRQPLLFCAGLLLISCATNHQDTVAPASWVPDPDIANQTGCPIPVGLFANQGQSSPPADAQPVLTDFLFEHKMKGYPVEAVRFRRGASDQELEINAVLAGQDLRAPLASSLMGGETLQPYFTLTGTSEKCSERWQIKVVTDRAGATMVSESLLWTGGTLMPLNEVSNLTLYLANDGALLVHLRQKSRFLVTFLLPVSSNNEYWLRFSPVAEIPNRSDAP